MATDFQPQPQKTYAIPGTMVRSGARKRENVDFFVEAEDREHARWQVHHGVIETEMLKTYPGADYHFDLRRMRLHRDPAAGKS